MNKSNFKFMRVLFIALVISCLIIGLFDFVNLRGQAVASIVLLLLLLFVEIINLRKKK